jgi:hypothetical protein
MRQRLSYLVFVIFLLCMLALPLGRHLGLSHSLYLMQIEDPGPRFSFYPWLVYSARSFREGWFPLWNHLSGTGFPHLANYQSTPLNPLQWGFYLYPSLHMLDAMVILRLALLGLFTFMFLRRIKLAPLAAAAGALAFTFSGYVMKHQNQINIGTEMWIPLSLYLVHGQLKDRPTLRRLILSGLVSALAFLGGNPEAAFYFVIITLLYGLFLLEFSPGRTTRQAFCLIMPLLFGGILASAQLLPFIEYLGQGWHIHTGKLHILAAHSPGYFYSLLLPWLCGEYRSFDLQFFTLPYIGMITALFALIAFLHAGRGSRALLFCLTYIIVFLAVIYRIPPLGWINYLPVFRQSGNVKFAMAGVSFCFAVAAGMGLDLVINGRMTRKMLAAALGVMTALVFISISVAILDTRLPGLFRPGWLYPLLCLLACGFILIMSQRRANTSLSLSAALVGIMAIELVLLFQGFRPVSRIDPSRWRFENPVPPHYIEGLAQKPLPDRFLAEGDAIHHSMNLLYRLNDFRAFEAMYPGDYVAAIGRIEGFTMAQSVAAFFQHGWSFDVKPENLGHPLLDLLGIRYAFLSRPIQARGWSLRQDGLIKTYENTEALPRVFLVRNLSKPLAPIAGSAVKLLSYDAQRVAVRIDSAVPCHLVLTDTYFPGWQARLDDQPVKINKVEELVRAIPLPAGKHLLEMRYCAFGFRLGLWITLASLCFVLIPLVYKVLSGRAYPRT